MRFVLFLYGVEFEPRRLPMTTFVLSKAGSFPWTLIVKVSVATGCESIPSKGSGEGVGRDGTCQI